jgi:hypothetical protein
MCTGVAVTGGDVGVATFTTTVATATGETVAWSMIAGAEGCAVGPETILLVAVRTAVSVATTVRVACPLMVMLKAVRWPSPVI